jgi:HK97 family phage major capsid protein
MKLGNNRAKELQLALQGENEAEIQQAWTNFSDSIVDEIRNDYMESVNDKNILAQRGYRNLTNAEEKYYNALITASKSRNVQQAATTLADLTDNGLMPETIIDQVLKDVVAEHPILAKVNFQYAKYATKIIMNDHSKQNAVWGEIDAEITKEITSAFKVLSLAQNKLSAFAVIPMGLLDMGPTFLDGYIRTILKDAIACGLEEAIIKGDGDGKPVGLMMKLTGAVDGVHQAKEAVAVTDFGVKSMGALIARMAKNEKGQNRPVGHLSLICNANDYYTLVAPAVRVQNMSGAYVDNFAFPMEVVISEEVEAGKAILADLNKYFVGIGFAKEGVIEFSDEAQFLADKRVYKIKTYANGRAMDENSALLLDISGLQPAVITVKNA